MMPIVVFGVFFGALVISSLIAFALGTLPTAEQLEVQDRVRFAQYERSLIGEQPATPEPRVLIPYTES